MSLTSIMIAGEHAAKFGLQDQSFKRLEQFVVLAGRNGSGKSRILNAVAEAVSASNLPESEIAKLREEMLSQSQALDVWRASGDRALQVSIDQIGRTLGALRKRLLLVDSLSFKGDSANCIPFSPSSGLFSDSSDMSRNSMRQHAAQMRVADSSRWKEYVLPYIQLTQDNWREATHGSPTPGADDGAIEEYNSLNAAIAAFFGEELGRDAGLGATLFGKPIARAQLSSGESIALQLIVSLHAKAGTLGPAILIMDEPETHLHPGALVDLLERIREKAPDVQMWIATHSIPLLAYINAVQNNAIWMVKDGKAEFAGRQPQAALNELLGGEERIAHLTSFLSLPSQLAINNFSYECLLPPGVVYTDSADRQLQQIKAVLGALRTEESLRVVDFGAGKGRLLQVLQSHEIGHAKFDYVAFDLPSEDASFCREVISAVFESADGRYFSTAEALISAKGEHWADCLVMTNVLHEIPPAKWLALFSSAGLPSRALRSDGYLLVVEDQQIPVGELAHQHGFLVMNSNQLKKLFKVLADDVSAQRFSSRESEDGRLAAHLVHSSLFNRVDADSRKEAIKALRDHAKSEIESLRMDAAVKDYKNGMKHAFWTQQLANAVLALDEL